MCTWREISSCDNAVVVVAAANHGNESSSKSCMAIPLIMIIFLSRNSIVAVAVAAVAVAVGLVGCTICLQLRADPRVANYERRVQEHRRGHNSHFERWQTILKSGETFVEIQEPVLEVHEDIVATRGTSQRPLVRIRKVLKTSRFSNISLPKCGFTAARSKVAKRGHFSRCTHAHIMSIWAICPKSMAVFLQREPTLIFELF